MKFLLIGVLTTIALVLGSVAASNARPLATSREQRLAPTWFIHAIAIGTFAILIFVAFAGWDEKRPDQVSAIYLLLVGFGVGLFFWVWYFYVRMIYWNAEGVGYAASCHQGSFRGAVCGMPDEDGTVGSCSYQRT